jgi:hypothetical protein
MQVHGDVPGVTPGEKKTQLTLAADASSVSYTDGREPVFVQLSLKRRELKEYIRWARSISGAL